MSYRVPIFTVDAFTDRAFGGNPAAVCLLESAPSDEWMQQLAAEMNLSETAYLYPEGRALRLRWFTPAVEVDLCGHATLAAAHVLWETGRLAPDARAEFISLSGPLAAAQTGAGISLDFPAKLEKAAEAPSGLITALGVDSGKQVRYVGRNAFDYIVQFNDAAALRALQPDVRALAGVEARGVIVTSLSDDPNYDFLSRFFAPAAGVDEDPVTGSAHCCLGPFWQSRLGRSELVGFQASRRGGTVAVRMESDRVHLIGRAVTILRGELAIPPE